MGAIAPKTNFCWRKTMTRCCAWLHIIYGRANQRNNERVVYIAKKKNVLGGGRKRVLRCGRGEIQEVIHTTPEDLTEDNLMEMSSPKPVPGDEEENLEDTEPANKLTLDSLHKSSDYSRLLLVSFMTWTLYGTGTETKANSGKRNREIFLEKWKGKVRQKLAWISLNLHCVCLPLLLPLPLPPSPPPLYAWERKTNPPLPLPPQPTQ